MASPSNASEPEPTDEEVEYIEAGFDPILFWDQYRQVILAAAGVVVLAVIGYGIYQFMRTQKMEAAATALNSAQSEEDYRQVMDKYAGTNAAGNAALLLSGTLRAEHKYDDSTQVLQDFLAKYPNHPLAGGAELGIAENLEQQNKTDEAMAKYQELAAKYPDSYAAPLAVIAQANILKSQGKTEDARRLYQNFVPQFPDSVFSQLAMTEMQLMQPAAGADSSPSQGGIPDMLNQIPAAPTPAPTAPATSGSSAIPAASLPPVIPALPGANATPALPSVPAASPH